MNTNKQKIPIYLQTWFIAILFALWIFIIPLPVGVCLLFERHRFDKQARKEAFEFQEQFNAWYESEETQEQIKTIKTWEKQKDKREKYNQELSETRSELQKEIKTLKAEMARLQSDVTVETTIFSTVDESISSEEYKSKYNLLVLEEKEIIKQNKSIDIIDKSISSKIISNDIKQLQRCFNCETDALLRLITFKNVETVKGRIIKTFETLNKLFSTDGICLTKEILEIKLKETDLLYGYEYQKEQERLQQKAIREQMVEEEKVRREIEREKASVEKEEKQFKNEIDNLTKRISMVSEIEKSIYLNQIKELQEKLKQVEESKKNILNREKNTRAGYVYIISNIGSFGENVYKIGMTRRLDPMDRVNELGDASVPFEFDVHAMIFSEDAPKLESILHSKFDDKRVNMVNRRKEFFRVSLDEIENVVKTEFNATVNFTKTAQAVQFRESQKIQQKSC